MSGRNKDSKFVIYQVLYIFVITVLAIKGANLDLSEVISREKAVSRNVKDSLMVVIDSLSALGLKVDVKADTTKLVMENDLLKNQISVLTSNIASLKKEDKKPEVKIEPSIPAVTTESAVPNPSAVLVSQVQRFIQNTWNLVKNNGNLPIEILDKKANRTLATVLPGEEKKFDLTDQDEIVARSGKQEQLLKVDKNKPPDIKIETVSSKMNNRRVYVEDLQKTTSFKITITDERPEQIKVSYTGPISMSGPFKVNENQLIYNVSLKIAPNENVYDEWVNKTNPLKENDGRYKVNFFMIAVDQKNKDKVQAGESFYFTDYSR
jgi:hypothetical protein